MAGPAQARSIYFGPVNFEVSHYLPYEPRAVAAALLDEGYQATLIDVGGLKQRTVLSQKERPNGDVIRRTRCVLDLDLQGPARRFIGDGEPAWVEEAIWRPEEQRWDWDIQPEVGAELLEASGSIALEPDGGGTVRRVEGMVKVKVPLYGGRVESWIVDGLRRAYDDEAQRLAAWLARVTPP